MKNIYPSLCRQLVALIDEYNDEVYSISIAHTRDEESRILAENIKNYWEKEKNWIRDSGGTVLTVIDFPETAASWLRQAHRLASDNPDIYIIIGNNSGVIKLLDRLANEPNWSARNTFVLFNSTTHLRLDNYAEIKLFSYA